MPLEDKNYEIEMRADGKGLLRGIRILGELPASSVRGPDGTPTPEFNRPIDEQFMLDAVRHFNYERSEHLRWPPFLSAHKSNPNHETLGYIKEMYYDPESVSLHCDILLSKDGVEIYETVGIGDVSVEMNNYTDEVAMEVGITGFIKALAMVNRGAYRDYPTIIPKTWRDDLMPDTPATVDAPGHNISQDQVMMLAEKTTSTHTFSCRIPHDGDGSMKKDVNAKPELKEPEAKELAEDGADSGADSGTGDVLVGLLARIETLEATVASIVAETAKEVPIEASEDTHEDTSESKPEEEMADKSGAASDVTSDVTSDATSKELADKVDAANVWEMLAKHDAATSANFAEIKAHDPALREKALALKLKEMALESRALAEDSGDPKIVEFTDSTPKPSVAGLELDEKVAQRWYGK